MTSLLQHSQSRTAHRNSKPLAPVNDVIWSYPATDLMRWKHITLHHGAAFALKRLALGHHALPHRTIRLSWSPSNRFSKYIFPKNVVFESNYSHESDKKLCHVPRLINMRALGICFSSSWLIDRGTGHRPRSTLSESALVFVSLMLFRCWF